MAARTLKPRHQDDIRAKIQAAHIVRRFHQAFDGEIALTNEQISIGKALLNKAIPDLKAMELSGDPDNPVRIEEVRRKIIDPCQS